MVSNNRFAQGFAEVLEKVCQDLTPQLLVEDEQSPLRLIELFLWTWVEEDEEPPKDEDLKFLYFFFDTFLEKFFHNLGPEIPLTKPVEFIYQTFIDKLKEAFGEFAKCLRDGGYAGLYPSYKKMGLAFLATVNALNHMQ